MSTRSHGMGPPAPWSRRYRVTGCVTILLTIPVGLLLAGSDRDTAALGGDGAANASLPAAHAAPAASGTLSPSPAPTPFPCIGPPLVSQSQVRANASYCGGRAVSRIDLAVGDTWVGGEVTGVSTRNQQGAVNCPSNCTLVDMDIHDNPKAFAGIDVEGGVKTNVSIIGGRVSGSGSLGIGGGGVDGLVIHDVEIDHNGVVADCNFEGGGFKGGDTHHLHFFGNYVHDNNCAGVWLDINSADNQIDHNRVIDNLHEGIFYEISQDAVIDGNDVEGNGFHTNGNGCAWLWGGGISIASSFNIQIFNNTLVMNCNGITGTQQNRTDSVPPVHLLENLMVHDNRISGNGETGVAADNGDVLITRNIVFANNSYNEGMVPCQLTC